jgi:uncharacterized protein YqjF (DUF2071 family)
MFRADWNQALFIHFRIDPTQLQPFVPFPLDIRDGDAFVSLVAFTQSRLRPAFGGAVAAALMAPLAEHEFLNLRAYVRANDEPAIYFISEWIPNRLAVLIGPRLYGLPYRPGAHRYEHAGHAMRGSVRAAEGRLKYRARVDADPASAAPGTLDHFLLERYLAFTHRNGIRRSFRVEHGPWPQARAWVDLVDDTLLRSVGGWTRHVELIGGSYSTGVSDVTICAPQKWHDPGLLQA